MTRPALRLVEAERFDLRTTLDGYAIYDRGSLICTFRGPQFDLASATLRRLRDDTPSHRGD